MEEFAPPPLARQHLSIRIHEILFPTSFFSDQAPPPPLHPPPPAPTPPSMGSVLTSIVDEHSSFIVHSAIRFQTFQKTYHVRSCCEFVQPILISNSLELAARHAHLKIANVCDDDKDSEVHSSSLNNLLC